MPDINPLSLVISPDNRSFVIVTPKEWLLYTSQNSHFICAVACPIGSEWLSAKYLDHETLLVWTSQAVAAAYRSIILLFIYFMEKNNNLMLQVDHSINSRGTFIGTIHGFYS